MPTNHLKSPEVYGNWLMLSPDGEEMCRCSQKRASWYLKRGLAEIVVEDPPTFKLKFQPNGPGHRGDQYYLGKKKNICVVCGTTERLTKHHVIPQSYRKFLPNKSRNSHDILVVCVPCHVTYHSVSDQLCKLFLEELEITVERPKVIDEALIQVIKYSKTLLADHQIPQERIQTMHDFVKNFLNKEPSAEDLLRLSKIKRSETTVNSTRAGQLVAEAIVKLGKVREFCSRWRQHFVDTMKPQHMPEAWKIDRED